MCLFAPAATQVRAVLWEGDKLLDLGTLGGDDAFTVVINERGQIAGASYASASANLSTGRPTLDPLLWEKGEMVDLGSLGGTKGSPNWINNRGQVVGKANMGGDQTGHPFSWDRDGGMIDFGTLGGNSGTPYWVNDTGEAAGYADFAGSGAQLHHAFVWRSGTMTDHGTAEGDICSVGLSINSSGQITGASTSCMGYVHGLLWENGGPWST